MNTVLNTMNVEKISEIMEKFEEDNETLDVRTKYMDTAISNTVSGATPELQVTELLQQVGEDIGVDYMKEFQDPSTELAAGVKKPSLESRMQGLNE